MTIPSIPVLVLTGAGFFIAALALLAAGNVGLVMVGLGAVFTAGILQVAEIAVRSRARRVDEEQGP